MNRNIIYSSVIMVFSLVSLQAVCQDTAAAINQGKALFTGRCASCHNVNKKLTGPALANVEERHDLPWILSFVKSSQTMVKAGDKAALQVYNDNNQVAMPDHPDLDDEQIKSILAYIKSDTKAPGADDAPFERPVKLLPHHMPLSIYNYPFMIVYVALIVAMIGVMIFLVNVKSFEQRQHPEKLV
jgi:mono/diheme cytochrome c family protein